MLCDWRLRDNPVEGPEVANDDSHEIYVSMLNVILRFSWKIEISLCARICVASLSAGLLNI